MEKFDAIIIGTGQSGKPLAIALADEGWKVAVAEEKYIGGTCVNYGCTPTKAIVSSAKAAYTAQRLKDWGIKAGKVSVDFKEVMARKDKIVKSFRASGKNALESNKNITMFYGIASFTGTKAVEVKTAKQSKHITAEYIFIDTGAKPSIPPIEGLDKIDYLTSESILALKKLPDHLVILGGGYISLEFAQMFTRFGSKVTVIEQGERFLAREDEVIAEALREVLESEKIKILTSAKTTTIEKLAGKKIMLTLSVQDKIKNIIGSHLLVATGIKPSTDKLNLQMSGIEADERGFIRVNNKLETNIPGIYAMGDVKGGPAFTHISYDDYRIVYGNIVKKQDITTDNRLVPYVLFTDPELGRIGLSEQEAVKKGYNIKTAVLPMKHVARAIESGETKGMMKGVVDSDTGLILGCAMLGISGGEMMSLVEMAMVGGLHYTKLKDGIFAHPTLAEAMNNLFSNLK